MLGRIGEYVVDASYLSSGIDAYGEVRVRMRAALLLSSSVAEWLKRLGLVHDFRVEALAENRRVFEVKVRKSPKSAEVLPY